jgi:alpha-tubulin suppressor-like RCC1 family protein
MKRYVVATAICGLLLAAGWWSWKNFSQNEIAPAQGSASAASSRAAADEGTENPNEPENRARAAIRRPTLATLAADPRTAMAELPEGELRRGLAALPETVRAEALARLAELRVPFNDHAALRVDLGGNFYYVCAVPPGVATQARAALPEPGTLESTQAATAAGETAAAAVPISQPPVRHSRPGAARVAYLDFNGHTVTGTAWNTRYSVTTFATRAYDTDGSPTTFSDAEQAAILRIWARVAEDFAPFEIDVTTEEPAVFTSQTARILITRSTDANGVTNPEGGGAGGVAFLDVFGRDNYSALSPAFVYYNNLGNDANVAEAASHELGHNLALAHDGTTTLAYYGGHGAGETSWGPIMGTGYGRNVSQWSKGEYFKANNTQDDLAILAARLTYRADDAGDTNATAQALTLTGNSLAGAGVIERSTDADRFSFPSGAGAIALSVTPFRTGSGTHGGNLDVKLELYDASGTLLAVADPPATTTAAISTNVVAGTYFLRVSPASTGTPLASVPSGYVVYGSGGDYTISGTTVAGAVIAPAFTVQPADQSIVAGASVTLSASVTGTTPLALEWRKVGSPTVLGTGSSLVLPAVAVAAAGEYQLTASNAAGSVVSRAARLSVVPAAVPPAITTQPVAQVRVAGSAAEFLVEATGTGPLTYQWRRNGVALAGATTARLAWTTVALADAGSYSVVVSNAQGAVTSEPALLTVNAAPVFTEQPVPRAVSPGSTATFSAAATGVPVPTLRWQRSSDDGVSWTDVSDGAGVSGAATAMLTLTNLTEASSGQRFRCVATNSVAVVASDPASLTVAVLPAVIGIASGGNSTFFLKADGTVWATGLNTHGQFGDGTTLARSVPVKIAEGGVAVAAGAAHALVLKADGTLWAAGANNFGQLGDGTSIDRPYFVKIASDVAAVAAATYNSAFIGRDGRLWVMGRNAQGELGHGTLAWAASPVNIGAAVRAVVPGHFHLAYVTTTGELRTTGGNERGQLGDGTTTDRLTPVTVATEVRQVTTAYRATLFVKSDGTAWAAGENNWSQFGDGTQNNRTTFGPVGSGVRRLASSFTHTLRLATDGQLSGSGDNRYGQLGDGTVATRATGAVVTTAPLAFVAGSQNSHWVTSDGSTWAAGKNSYGQLGDGSTLDRSVPVKIFTGLPTASAPVTGVRATNGESSEFVRVTWDHALGATGYEVWRHTADDAAGATRLEADERVNFFEDRSAVLGVTYFYWVKSVGSGGVSAFSAGDSGYLIAESSLPSFLAQPVSVGREVGESAQFSIAVAGGATVTLQWQLSVNGGAAWSDLADGGDFLGTRSATLSVAPIRLAQAGWQFRCVATNANGSVAS